MAAIWFIVFPHDDAVRAAPWWARLLKRGYRHCLACAAPTETETLVIDHRGSHLHAAVEPVPIGAFLRGLQQTAGCWIIAMPTGQSPPRGMLRPAMTCVEACKALLGIRAWWIVTPRQLARHLMKTGGKPVLPS